MQTMYLIFFTKKLINNLWQDLSCGSFKKKHLPWFFKFASDMTTALPIFKLMYDVSWYSTTFLTLCFTMTLHLFLVRVHCSVYIINSLLATCCMCRWVSGLFNCKPRLIKFFHFMRSKITGGLHFLFLYFIEGCRWRSVFPWLRFVDQTFLSQSIFFSMCTSVKRAIMINRKHL